MSAHSPEKRRGLILLPCLLLTAIAAGMIFSSESRNPSTDEAMWSYIGWNWTEHGAAPFVDSFDHKPPFVYEVYAVSNTVCPWAPVHCARWIGMAAMLAGAWIVCLLVWRWAGRSAGLVAMLLFGLTMSRHVVDGAHASHTESFGALLAVLGFWLVDRMRTAPLGRRSLLIGLAGLALGFASLGVRQSELATAAALLVFYLLMTRREPAGRRLRELGIAAGGVLIAGLLVMIPLWLSGATPGNYIHACWLSIGHVSTIQATAAERIHVLSGFWQESFLVVLLIGALAFVFLRRRIAARGVPVWGLLVWAGLAFAAANVSGNNYGHQQKQAVLPLAILTALAIVELVGLARAPRKGPGRAEPWLVVLTLVFAFPLHAVTDSGYGQPDPAEFRAVAKKVRELSSPGEYVYVHGWGAEQVQFRARRQSPTRHFNGFFLAMPGAHEQLRTDLTDAGPRLIVAPAPSVGQTGPGNLPEAQQLGPWFADLLEKRYRPVEDIGGWRIYEYKTSVDVPFAETRPTP
ncbi:MAG: hypothetical protein ACLFVU_00565 [Phycisphaerae bacterium]